MSYLGTKPGNQITTAQQIVDGIINPAKLSPGAPSWDSSGNLTLDNGNADGAQLVLKSSGYSDWNWDNYSGRIRAYYGSTEYFTINSSGNVGVGTSSPDVFGRGDARNVGVSVAGASDNTALSLNAGASAGRGAQIYMGQGGTRHFTVASNLNESTIGTVSSTPLRFTTGDTERARIDSSGRLLVGKTTNGDYVAGVEMQPAGAVLSYRTSGVAAIFGRTDNGETVRFTNNGNGVGTISTTGSATAYNTSSDYRLKENIAPMTGALSVVQQLKPVTYNWKVDGSDGQGFIAHELQAVVPDCVTGEKDAVDADGNPVYQGIDTSFLVATLTAAIQEQQAIITQLRADVEALKGN